MNLRMIATQAVAVGVLASTAVAQSAQPVSLQASLLGTAIQFNGSTVGGVGFEPQLRFNRVAVLKNRGVVSLGLGGQFTHHVKGSQNLDISGFFVEPRLALPTKSEVVFPYIAARIAILSQSSNFAEGSTGNAIGAGGGFVVPLGRKLNLDAGVALVSQTFGKADLNNGGGTVIFSRFLGYAAKIGFNLGI